MLVSSSGALKGVDTITSIVGMSSWRDQVRISGEWSSSDNERDYTVRFLRDVIAIMRLLVA